MSRILDEREASPWAELRELAVLRQSRLGNGQRRKPSVGDALGMTSGRRRVADEVLAWMERMGFEIIPDLHLGAGYFRTMVVKQGADYVRYRERILEEKPDVWAPSVTRVLKRELDASSDSFASETAQALHSMMALGSPPDALGRRHAGR